MLLDPHGTPLGPAFTGAALPQCVIDLATLQILAVNQAATALYGLSAEELVTLTLLQLHPDEEWNAVRSHVWGPTSPIAALPPTVWRHHTRAGQRRVRLALSELRLDTGEARLAQVVEMTEMLPIDGSDPHSVLASVGHELRQPLTPIIAAIALMEKHVSRQVGVRAREIIKRQVGVLMQIIDDLLDVARLQKGKLALKRETHDLRILLEEVVAAHFPEITAHELLLDTTLPPVPVWVKMDARRFHQIAGNLLSNAIRHSKPGGRLSFRLETIDGMARLTVADDGDGIDGALLPRIFEPFAQSVDGARGVLGVGLSIVRGLVELHDGRVTVSSDGAGRGAEFLVTLPVCAMPLMSPKAFASDLRSVAESIKRRALTDDQLLDGALDGVDTALLVADDDSRILNANQPALAMLGYSGPELTCLTVADILSLTPTETEDYWHEFSGRGCQEGILVLRRKDGSRLPVRYSAIQDVRPGRHLSALDAL